MKTSSEALQVHGMRIARPLLEDEHDGWYRTAQRKITENFKGRFHPRKLADVSMANLICIDDLPHHQKRGLNGMTDGEIRRIAHNSLPSTRNQLIDGRVMWTVSLGNPQKPHIGIAIKSPEISHEIQSIHQSLNSVGYHALSTSYIGPHLSFGTFDGSNGVPKDAVRIVNDLLPAQVSFEPISITRF